MPTVPLTRGEAVVMLSGGAVELMVSMNAFDALPERMSITWAVKLDVLAVVGVPLIAPEVAFKVRPTGKLPVITDQA